MNVVKQVEHELIVGGVYKHKLNYPHRERLCILVNNEKKLMCTVKYEVLTSKYKQDSYEFIGMAKTLIIN